MKTFKDISGQRYGRLTVSPVSEKRGKHRYWLCFCDCGNKKYVCASNLYNKHAQSCGCLNSELSIKRNTTHNKSKTITYKSWKGLFKRCNNQNDKNHHNYGGRGISVCARWSKYENFYADMGEKPSNKHSIDRIDNNGNYSPENCRWALKKIQANNTRANVLITHNGLTLTVSEWADRSLVSYNTFWQRLYTLKWDIEKALNTPKM